MSVAEYIEYLGQVKSENLDAIAANNSAITSITELNTTLAATITSNEAEITSLGTSNTELAANNTLIDSLIAYLGS